MRRHVGDHVRVGLRHLQEVLRRAQARGFDGAGDIEHGESLGNDDSVEIDVAAEEALLDVDNVVGLFEEIFSGFERAVTVNVMPEDEGLLTADYAGGFEFRGDAAAGVARMQQDEGLPRWFRGSENCPREPTRGRQQCNEDEPE